jgi:hypothetical protein
MPSGKLWWSEFDGSLKNIIDCLQKDPFPERKEEEAKFNEIEFAQFIKRYMTRDEDFSEEDEVKIESLVIPCITLSSSQCIKVLQWVATERTFELHFNAVLVLMRYISWRGYELSDLDRRVDFVAHIATEHSLWCRHKRFGRLIDGMHEFHVLLKRIQ